MRRHGRWARGVGAARPPYAAVAGRSLVPLHYAARTGGSTCSTSAPPDTAAALWPIGTVNDVVF